MARCREHDRRAVLLYEDEFELTFDTPEEEPVYEPENCLLYTLTLPTILRV